MNLKVPENCFKEIKCATATGVHVYQTSLSLIVSFNDALCDSKEPRFLELLKKDKKTVQCEIKDGRVGKEKKKIKTAELEGP